MEKTRAAIGFPLEPQKLAMFFEDGDVVIATLKIKAESIVPFSYISLEDLPIFEFCTFPPNV